MRAAHRARVAGAVAALLVAGCSSGAGDGGRLSASALPECLDFEAMYALVGPESLGLTSWSDASELAGELGSAHASELPDAALEVTAPGEESGTYDTFVELVIEDIADERGQQAETRPDYTSQSDDNVIVESVSGTSGSFGWVGYAFYVENREDLEAFAVADENGTCVEPTGDTIASGAYSLSRPLFIYVNSAHAAANPALACFVDTYVGDVGLEQVAAAGYVQLTREAWAGTAAAWDAEGSPGGDCADLSGEVTVSGSSTVEPISSRVAEQFAAEHPSVGMAVDGPGTGDGFELFCSGETDISDASRPIKDEEAQACADSGVEYVELRVGIDGLAVITSP